MKGVVCAGGTGSRLMPCTRVTNKHLLPVYDFPMIYYPIHTLMASGIKDIMIISGRGNCGQFLELLGGTYTYRIQEGPTGIAGALKLARDWVGDDDCAVILGDNIYEDTFRKEISEFKGGCHLFLKWMDDPRNFGVAHFNQDQTIRHIFEKPDVICSHYAVTGLYLYDNSVFAVIDTLQMSRRGEYEITDVNNKYVVDGACRYSTIEGFWSDAGTFESLFNACMFMRMRTCL